MSKSQKRFRPILRTNSAPLHPNAVRRFREELRLNRTEFSELVGVCPATLRVWETANRSRPGGRTLMRLLQLAEENNYPLDPIDLYSDVQQVKTSSPKIDKKKKRA